VHRRPHGAAPRSRHRGRARCLADRQSQAYSTTCPRAATLELLEQPRGLRPAVLAVIVQRDLTVSRRLRQWPTPHACAGRGVLGDVCRTIGQTLHDERRITTPAQVGGEAHLHGWAASARRNRRGRSHQVIECLPVPRNTTCPDSRRTSSSTLIQLRHLARLGLYRARQRHAGRFIEIRAVLGEGAARTRHHGERVRRSCDMDASSVLRSVSRSAARLDCSATSARCARASARAI